MQELEHLKQIVLEGAYDEESKTQIRDLEKRLHKLSATEKLAGHPVMAEYLAYLNTEVTRCKELLSEDDKLVEIDRIKLFERIKQSREFLNRFDPSQKRELEKSIKDLLHVARSQN